MKQYRDCGSESFNTGSSFCPFDPEYIETIILTSDSTVIPKDDLEKEIGKLAHADRPGRLYPIGPMAEYAPSGGEGQTNKQGYGASKLTGYSELQETWTLDNFDIGLNNNLMDLKNEKMRAVYIDRGGRVHAEDAGGGNIRGTSLSSVYPQAVRFKTSGDNAKLSVVLIYKDVETAWKNSIVVLCDRSILEEAKGLVWVDVVKVGDSGSSYKVIEHYGGFDLTEIMGVLLGKADAWSNATASTYDSETATLSLTTASGVQPKLKSPSALYEAGIKGIEQWFES